MEPLPDIYLPLEAMPWQSEHFQRRQSADKLLIHLLLEAVVEEADDLYPPDGPAGLRRLLAALHEEGVGAMQAIILQLYLILDYDDSERFSRFVREHSVPSTFVRLIVGTHALDNGRYCDAVGALAAAVDDIDLLSPVIQRLSADPASLAAFVRLAQPVVHEEEDVAAIIIAFVREGHVAEAWQWARKWSATSIEQPNREDGVRLILGTAFADDGQSQPVAAAVQTLLVYPFEGEGEDEAVWRFCAEPTAEMAPASRDLLANWAAARLTAEGRHREALVLLQSPALAPQAGEATARRQLVIKGLQSVLAETTTSIDALLRVASTSAPRQDFDASMDVDLTSTPWAHAAIPSPPPLPHSLRDVRTNEAALHRRPSSPAQLPASASPVRRSVLPASASPFRNSPSQKGLASSRSRMQQIASTSHTFSPAPSSPAPSTDFSRNSIAPLGPRRPAPPSQPISYPSLPKPKEDAPSSRSRKTPIKDKEPAAPSRTTVPGGWDAESVDDGASTHEEPTTEPEARVPRSTKRKGTKSAAKSRPVVEEEPEMQEVGTPRRSKRISVQRHTSPEEERPPRRTAGRGKGKAKS